MKKPTLNVKSVSFDEDGLVALYVDDILVHEGHCNDAIHDQLDGWVMCLEHQGNKIKREHFYVEVSMDEYPEEAPKTMKDLLKQYKKVKD